MTRTTEHLEKASPRHRSMGSRGQFSMAELGEWPKSSKNGRSDISFQFAAVVYHVAVKYLTALSAWRPLAGVPKQQLESTTQKRSCEYHLGKSEDRGYVVCLHKGSRERMSNKSDGRQDGKESSGCQGLEARTEGEGRAMDSQEPAGEFAIAAGLLFPHEKRF